MCPAAFRFRLSKLIDHLLPHGGMPDSPLELIRYLLICGWRCLTWDKK
jgi:hypothetical protein